MSAGAFAAVDAQRTFVVSELAADDNVIARFELQQRALAHFLDQPVVGVGLGGLSEGSAVSYPHNVPIEILSEAGVIGLCASLLVVWIARRGVLKRPDIGVIWLLIILFSLTSGDLAGNWMVWGLASVLSGKPSDG
jgi:O-antigen ligase